MEIPILHVQGNIIGTALRGNLQRGSFCSLSMNYSTGTAFYGMWYVFVAFCHMKKITTCNKKNPASPLFSHI